MRLRNEVCKLTMFSVSAFVQRAVELVLCLNGWFQSSRQ